MENTMVCQNCGKWFTHNPEVNKCSLCGSSRLLGVCYSCEKGFEQNEGKYCGRCGALLVKPLAP